MCRLLRKCLALLWRKCWKRKNLIFLPLILILVYFEWLIYLFLPLSWPELECGLSTDVHKILFVADPQILGENTEPVIARVDSDLDLKTTFNKAFKYVKPDLIIFLGDLMDEGSTATPQEYQRYYKRFRDIFQLDYISPNKTIFIPGDNDIGGENEDITEYKVRRYHKYFPSKSDVTIYKNLEIVKVNVMTQERPNITVPPNSSNLRILISHMPLLGGVFKSFGEWATLNLKPTLVFSAHDHHSVHVATKRKEGSQAIVNLLDTSKSAWKFNLRDMDDIVNEIVVPTSSYRMGTLDYGYGVAHLGSDGSGFCYFMLWSPKRLIFLVFYLVAAILTAIAYTCVFCIECCGQSRRDSYKFTRVSA